MNFIEKSISSLDEISYDLIMKIYIDKEKIAVFARRNDYTRQGIYWKINNILKPISKSFGIKYKSP